MKLWQFLTKRLYHTIITVLIVLVLLYTLFQAMPGDPASMLISPEMDQKAIERIKELHGLNDPWYVQFGDYIVNMLTFEFGYSFRQGKPVMDIIKQKLPPTLLLFGTATLLAYLIGVAFGATLAWKRGSKFEMTSIFFMLIFYSMPLFWFGLILLWMFASPMGVASWFDRSTGFFPIGGIGGYDPNTGEAYHGFQYVIDVAHHLVLPLISLCILSLAGNTLLMRNSMLEVMGEDYITTAKAKGVSEGKVLYKHAARNATLPIVTSFALSMGHVIGGGVLTETVFSWPGMGRELVTATIQQDFPVVFALFYIMALMTITANVVADLLYAYLDPRVRL